MIRWQHQLRGPSPPRAPSPRTWCTERLGASAPDQQCSIRMYCPARDTAALSAVWLEVNAARHGRRAPFLVLNTEH
jgi:hypothetical protein